MTLLSSEGFRRWLARFFFAYGCAGAVATAVCWAWSLAVAEFFRAHRPILGGFLVLFGSAYVFTMPYVWGGRFYGLLSESFPVDPVRIQPVVTVTPGRIRFARWALVIAAANALWWWGVALFVTTPQTVEHDLGPALASSLGASHFYIAMHWAFRPEHLFADTPFQWLLGRGWRDRVRAARVWTRRDAQLAAKYTKKGRLKAAPTKKEVGLP